MIGDDIDADLATPRLADVEVEHLVLSADGVLAAAGHTAPADPESDADLRAAIRGEISFDEAVERALHRVDNIG